MASSPTPPSQVRIVAEKISRYLADGPNAFDSLDGIIHWWLVKQTIKESNEIVQTAMDYLVTSGEVEQIQRGGKTYYASARRED